MAKCPIIYRFGCPQPKAGGYVNWHRLINAVKTKRGYLFVTASFLVI